MLIIVIRKSEESEVRRRTGHVLEESRTATGSVRLRYVNRSLTVKPLVWSRWQFDKQPRSRNAVRHSM